MTEPQPSTSTTSSSDTNPWQLTLGVAGFGLLLLGFLVYMNSEPALFADTSGGRLFGTATMSLGTTLVVAWLVVRALLWQMQRPASGR